MDYERTYLKKSITEDEILVRLRPEIARAKRKLADALECNEYRDAAYLDGLIAGLSAAAGMAACYFRNLDSQQETDRALQYDRREAWES